jgi:hypothetical protein
MAPDAPRPAERLDDAEARLARLDRLADMLDSRYSILGIRFGWDGIFGLVPVVGDAVTLASGGYMLMEGARMGARRRVLARMAANAGIDFFVGSVPILGDMFDVAFKANRRNIALLRRELAREGRVRAA